MKQWKIGRLSAGIGLILLGVLLIIARIQSLYYFEMLEKWWPVLIICLGIELVVGAFLAGNSKITVTVDGKSVFIAVLIVIFVFVGSGISFAARNKGAFLDWNGFSFNSYSNEKTVSNKMEFQGKKSITIENKQGKVSIDKSDSDKIEVEANIVIAYNDESAISELQKQAIEFADGEDLVVSTSNQSGKDGAVRKVDYTIKLPASVRYDVESAYGDVSISNISSDGKSSQSNGSTNITNVKGNTEITNKYGSVKVDTLEGNLQLSCNNGNINLFNVKGKIVASNSYGATNVESITDDIEFKGSNGAFTGKNLGGFTKVTSKYGDVNLTNPTKGLNVEANNGTIKIDCNKPIEGDVTVYSNYGSINTKIVKEQSAKFNCSSRNGTITNDLGLSGDNKNKNSTLGGEINGGKYLFMMETKNGSISIN